MNRDPLIFRITGTSQFHHKTVMLHFYRSNHSDVIKDSDVTIYFRRVQPRKDALKQKRLNRRRLTDPFFRNNATN